MPNYIKSRLWAILLAAGKGTRAISAGKCIPKQFLPYQNRPLYWHSALTLASTSLVDGIIFVLPPDHFEIESQRILQLVAEDNFGVEWKTVIGGQTRQESVFAGLSQIPSSIKNIIVHDSARPFLKAKLVIELCKMLDKGYSAVIPGVKFTDTIKICTDESCKVVEQTVPRKKIVAVQTPQAFDASTLREAHRKAREMNVDVTDDAGLMEFLGHEVRVVQGDPANIKITYPQDLALLESNGINKIPCSGFGYDAHRFGGSRPLRIGGVLIPCELQILAHSDGDVLLHALMDAILGCCCLGDIGQIFPDNDPKYENISSVVLLQHILDLAKNACLQIYHVDLTLVVQKPKIAPFREKIRENIAKILGIEKSMVGFKATTEENMGFTGAMEGIKAYALVNGWKHLSL